MTDDAPERSQPEGDGQDLPEQQPVKPTRTSRTIAETVWTVVVALVLALLIRQFVVESFVVQGVSMLPNLQNGEHLMVNKFVYDLHAPRIGDIIVFLPPPAAHTTQDFIKRVIAVAGDTVAVRNGLVYVNGRQQPEPYLPASYLGGPNFPSETVPRGDVFVLGDNRKVSDDSRYFGFVPIANIRGQADFAWWPPQAVGALG
jgi:signal peptidase I